MLLDASALRAILYAYHRDSGVQGGSFASALISAAQHADRANLDRLALGLPEYGVPMRMARFAPGGTETLEAALALLLAGLVVRTEDIDALGPEGGPTPFRARRAWLHQDIRDGLELADIIERERRLDTEESMRAAQRNLAREHDRG